MVEPSNITIGIVSDVTGPWRRKALGWFLEFRTIPVLLWSYTAVALGTGLAVFEGARLDSLWLAVAIALAGRIPGWGTPAANETFHLGAGTDGARSPPAPSGG